MTLALLGEGEFLVSEPGRLRAAWASAARPPQC